MDNNQLFKAIKGQRVLVIGDLMLDRYVHGRVDRYCPEDPKAPILLQESEEIVGGGAANVVANLGSLRVTPVVIGTVGEDGDAKVLERILNQVGAQCDLCVDPSRPTISKTRLIKGTEYLMRWDCEETHQLDPWVEQDVVTRIKNHMPNMTAVILSDYAKGILTPLVIRTVIDAARAQNIPVLVDPKSDDFSKYNGVDVVTPNLSELNKVQPVKNPDNEEDILATARDILAATDIGAMLVTRSEKGMVWVTHNQSVSVEAEAREVVEVSGAGDTVIATLAVCMAAGMDVKDAVLLANRAAARAVERSGTTTVKPEDLEEVA